MIRRFLAYSLVLAAFGWLSATSCGGKGEDLVLYCSLDQEFAEPLIRRYEAESGQRVRAEFDIEANKTVGLVMRLREEAAHPRCDVFWSSEPGHSVQLGVDGFLEPYDSPSAADIPAPFRDPEHRWTGFAARARIFIVNKDLCDPTQVTSMWDLVDPKWNGKVTMAKPITGTTMTHMAALYAALGEAKAEEYLQKIASLGKTGAINIANGNSNVARLVGDGKMAFGWTDTDDYAVTLERGAHVVAVYPDATTCGTLLLPNTVAILKGAPHLEAAKKFVDWVLRPEIEKELAFSRSAQIPVRASVERPPTVIAPGGFKALEVDYKAIGAVLERRGEHFKELFIE
jgi:iron(III) transport system substrate-binding protein